MVKLYLKKLLSSFLFVVIFFLFLLVVSFAWMHADSAIKSFLGITIPDAVSYCIILILTLVLDLVGVYFLRIDSLRYKEIFKKAHEKETHSFSKDFVGTLKSADNIVHTIAFLSLNLPFNLLITISANTPILPLIAGTLALLVVNGLLFSIINTFVWCLVHRNWLRK